MHDFLLCVKYSFRSCGGYRRDIHFGTHRIQQRDKACSLVITMQDKMCVTCYNMDECSTKGVDVDD